MGALRTNFSTLNWLNVQCDSWRIYSNKPERLDVTLWGSPISWRSALNVDFDCNGIFYATYAGVTTILQRLCLKKSGLGLISLFGASGGGGLITQRERPNWSNLRPNNRSRYFGVDLSIRWDGTIPRTFDRKKIKDSNKATDDSYKFVCWIDMMNRSQLLWYHYA
jgi:hypothetical protein